ncbi:hypothetical protein [Streptomyces sp. NRRL S-646]|nr:hypothetical protein [Streptomyces sp. NRRL S-646]
MSGRMCNRVWRAARRPHGQGSGGMGRQVRDRALPGRVPVLEVTA